MAEPDFEVVQPGPKVKEFFGSSFELMQRYADMLADQGELRGLLARGNYLGFGRDTC